jgi:RNA polymerase sigma factor (sigma-70 family)
MKSWEILRRALAGDEKAMAEFLQLLTPIFNRQAAYTVWRVGGSAEDAKQLSQDIFVALLSEKAAALRRYDPSHNVPPEAYFRTFAQFQCRTYTRSRIKNSHREKLTDPAELPQDPGDTEGPTDPFEQAERNEKLAALRSELDEASFDLFDRRYLRQQSAPEICADLGINEPTFYQRIHRLVKKLRDKGFLNREDKR